MAIDPRTGIDREAIAKINASSPKGVGYERVAFLSNDELATLQGRNNDKPPSGVMGYNPDGSYQYAPGSSAPVNAPRPTSTQYFGTGPRADQMLKNQNSNTTLPNLLPATGAKTQADGTKDNSAVIDANGAVVNTLPQGQDAGLPKATVATASNPVISRTKATKDNFAIPDGTDIASMDLAGVQDFIDYATIRQNSGKPLTEDEQFKLAKARRREMELAKPQDVGGGLNDRITEAKTNIDTRTKELATQDAEALAVFSANQDKQLQAGLDDIAKAEEQDRRTLSWMLGDQSGSNAAEQLSKITANSLAKRQLLRDTVQANIDLQGSKLRKDSQETIDKLQTSLDNMYLKASDLDVENAKALNEYNKDQSKDATKKIDDILALATAQQQAGIPLTAKEEADAQAYVTSLVKPDGSIDSTILGILQKTNPKIANRALMLSASLQKENMATKDFVKMTVQTGTDARGNPMTKEILYNPKTNETIDPSTGLTNAGGGGGGGGGLSNNAPAGGFRTDRNNNPVAMTTDVAKSLGLVEGEDYTKGDAFPNNPNLFTAKLTNGVDTVIKGFDKTADNPNRSIFTTDKGQPRRTYINMTDEQRKAMTPEQKKQTIATMYQNEGGDGSLLGGGKSQSNIKEPTASELAMYNEGTSSIKKGGLTQDRFNEIAQSVNDGKPQKIEPTNDPTTLADLELSPKATAEKGKSKAYADRMNYAVKGLLDVEKEFANRTTAGQAYQEWTPNFLKSEDQQFLDSAKQNFITASLRQESGASISPVEFAKEEKKYFPQIGDSIATVKAKQKAREFAIKAMYGQAGTDSNGNNIGSLYKERNIDDVWNDSKVVNDYLKANNL